MYDRKAPRLAVGNWISFAALVDFYDGAHWLRFVNAPIVSELRGPFGLIFVAAFVILPLVRRRSRR